MQGVQGVGSRVTISERYPVEASWGSRRPRMQPSLGVHYRQFGYPQDRRNHSAGTVDLRYPSKRLRAPGTPPHGCYLELNVPQGH